MVANSTLVPPPSLANTTFSSLGNGLLLGKSREFMGQVRKNKHGFSRFSCKFNGLAQLLIVLLLEPVKHRYTATKPMNVVVLAFTRQLGGCLTKFDPFPKSTIGASPTNTPHFDHSRVLFKGSHGSPTNLKGWKVANYIECRNWLAANYIKILRLWLESNPSNPPTIHGCPVF